MVVRSKKTKNRRLSNQPRVLSDDRKKAIARGLLWLVVLCIPVVVYIAFTRCYYTRNDLYRMTEPEVQVKISGDQTVPPEVLRAWTGLDKPINLFTYDIRAAVTRIKENAPAIRDIAMSIELPNTIHIIIDEREPIARLAQPYVMADLEGKVFRFQQRRYDLPEIYGLENDAQIQPGDSLPEYAMCALHLADNVRNNTYSFRVNKIRVNPIAPADGLLLKFESAKSARITWNDMEDEKAPSVQMDKSLRELSTVYAAPYARTFFNATVDGRVTTSD